ncbi:MAG TPA: hypothetical protein DIC53_05790, partial [Synergistaceae bacterium]|nr:hypothetical protein [Synergistaceae bacterium]
VGQERLGVPLGASRAGALQTTRGLRPGQPTPIPGGGAVNRSSSASPTREQLLATRRRIVAVQYGRKLLERKRDALIRSVEEQRRLFRRVRTEFEEWNRRITFLYSMVRMYEGSGGF